MSRIGFNQDRWAACNGPGHWNAPDKTIFVVRDLWMQKDRGAFKGKFETKVAPHGVVLIRLIPSE